MSDITRKEAIEVLKDIVSKPMIYSNFIMGACRVALASLETDEAYQLEYEPTTKIDYRRAFKIACDLLNGDILYGVDTDKIFALMMQKDGVVSSSSYEEYILSHLKELDQGQYASESVTSTDSTIKNDLGVDCNNCKNNLHRGDGTSYCATSDGMCHYECEEPTTKNDLGVDCISRKAVLDLLEDTNNGWIINEVLQLPSVTPQEPRKGHWVLTDVEGNKVWHCHCSECGKDPQDYVGGSENWWLIKSKLPKFCPSCGSDNREVEE